MINSVYNYYAAQYGHREYSKYDTHSKAQLKSTFGRLKKTDSQTHHSPEIAEAVL